MKRVIAARRDITARVKKSPDLKFLIVFAIFTPKKPMPTPGGLTERVHGPEMLAGGLIIL